MVKYEVTVTVPALGSYATQERWLANCQAAREKQTAPHAIAPMCSVQTARGLLKGGDEITAIDCGSWAELERLVNAGVVLSQPDGARRALACRADEPYRVGPRALVTRRGVLHPGEPLGPSDVEGGEGQLKSLVRRGLVVAREEPSPPSAA